MTVLALLAGLMGGAGVASASGEPPYLGFVQALDVGTDTVVLDVLAVASDPEGDPCRWFPAAAPASTVGPSSAPPRSAPTPLPIRYHRLIPTTSGTRSATGPRP
ncbi:MAG: hypothetical protein M5U19_06390 [Microthrixaceae bacterium]|nr:hypothetical protein [Microthrixaceae bacterium]